MPRRVKSRRFAWLLRQCLLAKWLTTGYNPLFTVSDPFQIPAFPTLLLTGCTHED